MSAATPTFLADPALGRLARWLRLLGYDTAYASGSDELSILRRARAEGRILLTRSRRLVRRRGLPPHIFITSDDFRAQLRHVLAAAGCSGAIPLLIRCSRCNAPLRSITRAEACAAVPAYVCATHARFGRCAQCGRVYWAATHVARMREELARVGLLSG